MCAVRRLVLTLLVLLGALAPARAQTESDLDLSSPRRALATFIQSSSRGDYQRAIEVMNVPPTASASRRALATETARKLEYMLARNASLDVDGLSDDPAGLPQDGDDSERVTTFESRGRTIPITLVRVGAAPGRWVFSPGTLARVPELYQAYGPSPLERRMPSELRREALGLARWQWIGVALAVLVAFGVAQIVVRLLRWIIQRFAARTRVLWDNELADSLAAPSKLLLSVMLFLPLVHALGMPANFRLMSVRAAGTLGIWAVAWFLMRIVALISNAFERRALRDAGASLVPPAARGVQTRVRILRRVVNVVLAICAGALILMQFEAMRSLGVSLLASAGVAGVVLGIAAQRTLGSVFAGIQLSITQPIRLGDEVIVEGEWGTIEEITLTYVVMRIWDERRLIIPTNRFFEQPFQNWTKVGTDLHGTVMLYTDYGLPVAELRAELERLVTGNPLWDGRTKVVHVTDAREKTIELRVLVSSSSAGKLFQLRAELREKLTAWLAALENGRYLPKTRLEEPDGSRTRPTPEPARALR